MHRVPLTCRRPGQAATEQRSTSEVIVPPVLLFPVGPGSRLLPEIGSDSQRDPIYELLNTSSAWRTNCIFMSQVGLMFQRLRELPLGFRQMPRRKCGAFLLTSLQVVSKCRVLLRCCTSLESV